MKKIILSVVAVVALMSMSFTAKKVENGVNHQVQIETANLNDFKVAGTQRYLVQMLTMFDYFNTYNIVVVPGTKDYQTQKLNTILEKY